MHCIFKKNGKNEKKIFFQKSYHTIVFLVKKYIFLRIIEFFLLQPYFADDLSNIDEKFLGHKMLYLTYRIG